MLQILEWQLYGLPETVFAVKVNKYSYIAFFILFLKFETKCKSSLTFFLFLFLFLFDFIIVASYSYWWTFYINADLILKRWFSLFSFAIQIMINLTFYVFQMSHLEYIKSHFHESRDSNSHANFINSCLCIQKTGLNDCVRLRRKITVLRQGRSMSHVVWWH